MRERSKVVGALGVLAGALCVYGAANATGSTTTAQPTKAAPNLVVNGAFALPASEFSNNLVAFLSPQGYAANNLPVKRIPGWSVGEGLANGVPAPNSGGVVVFHEPRVQMPNGAIQALQLSNNGPGNISATIKTIPGASYLLAHLVRRRLLRTQDLGKVIDGLLERRANRCAIVQRRHRPEHGLEST